MTYQIGALQAFAAVEGLSLQHVKPHGALYNMAAQDMSIWEAVAEVLGNINRDLILVVLAGSNREELEAVGSRYGIRIAFEFFADRAYNSDGTLVSRREKGAVIRDHNIAAERVLKMVQEGKVDSKDGGEIELHADTVCVHGDNPEAVALVKNIRKELVSSNVDIAPMGAFV